jgi:DNA-binding response OmpR family regulator
MRLLLVEDDARLASAVRPWLGHSGIDVDWIATGGEAEAALKRQTYDWIVLDLGLPDVSGEVVLSQLRKSGCVSPVIVITARHQVRDRVRLLDMGADDFLVKPVDLEELAARMRAVRRRHGSTADAASALRHGGLCLVPDSGTVSVDGQFVSLTKREFWLLEALLRRKGEVLTRAQLQEALYAEPDEIVGNVVDVNIHRLRGKLGAGWIQTVRGAGYRLHDPRSE